MDELVLVMSSRECIALRGFTTRLSMGVLESLQDETWFAVPEAIRADPLAVAVNLAVLIARGNEVLIDQDGRLLRPVPITDAKFSNGPPLVVLRRLAEELASERLGRPARAEIAGYLHDPVRLPHTFLLVYRSQQPPDAAVAAGAWMTLPAARGVVTDPIDRMVLEGMT